ncbi:MFP1 attachment factor 1-like [Hordeum vulgare]|nr:MFP1 attachment factor 1-like [Hordeum vulgare]
MVRRLVDTLAGDTLLCKRYGAVPTADAEPAVRAIEAEAFDAAVVGGGAAASVEEGIEALQLYSKDVSRHPPRLCQVPLCRRQGRAVVGGAVGRQEGDLRGLSSPRPR